MSRRTYYGITLALLLAILAGVAGYELIDTGVVPGGLSQRLRRSAPLGGYRPHSQTTASAKADGFPRLPLKRDTLHDRRGLPRERCSRGLYEEVVVS